ncbi:MAG: hypothetical protein M3270_04070, partial [Thermoproteota archaeon]|nr:hypothetical protein [Thermoproteota archaeon]
MIPSSRLPVSQHIAQTLIVVAIAIVLLSANFTVINAQLAQQQQQQLQQQQQHQSTDGGLSATLNGGNSASNIFTTGDTITVSGSVQERGSSLNVAIEVKDPQGQVVKRAFPHIAADNTFTYSFVAGGQEQFDPNAPMVASGTYTMIVKYFPPSDSIVVDEVQLPFGYRAAAANTAITDTTTTSPTAATITSATNNANINTTTSTNATNASNANLTTTRSSLQAPIQNGTTAAPTANINTVTSARTFQSTNDSFSIQVPQGWVIHDMNNTGLASSDELIRGYGILAQLCTVEEEQQELPRVAFSTRDSARTNSTNGDDNGCQSAQEDVIHVIRYPNLDTVIQTVSNNTTSNSTNTTATINGTTGPVNSITTNNNTTS